MFDWFFDFLYLITKTLLRLIDAILSLADILCGIEPVKVDGEETDLMSWLLSTNEIMTALKVAVTICIFLVVFFSIWKIVTMIVSEKPNTTPAQIMMTAGKNILIFLFIPAIFITLSWACNAIGEAMYSGTRNGASSIGAWLASSFGDECKLYDDNQIQELLTNGSFNYKSTSWMREHYEMNDYSFILSWLVGWFVLKAVCKAMLVFVNRVYSIVVLYIIAPFPICASIVDEGNHFKIWRDELLSQFLVGYCGIIGLNIFTLVLNRLVMGGVKYFDNGFLNFLFKVFLCLGGAMSIEKIMGMVGNLVKPGAGDNALKEAGQMAQGYSKIGSMLGNTLAAPFKKGAKKLAKKIAKSQTGGAGGGDGDGGAGGDLGDLTGGGSGNKDESGGGSGDSFFGKIGKNFAKAILGKDEYNKLSGKGGGNDKGNKKKKEKDEYGIGSALSDLNSIGGTVGANGDQNSAQYEKDKKKKKKEDED